MFCSKCGEENKNNAKFCSNCGEPLPDLTKPKENLVMPEDAKEELLKEENDKVIKHINKILTIIAYVLFGCAGLFAFISLIAKHSTTFLVFSIVCYIICIGLIISKIVINNHKDKKENK